MEEGGAREILPAEPQLESESEPEPEPSTAAQPSTSTQPPREPQEGTQEEEEEEEEEGEEEVVPEDEDWIWEWLLEEEDEEEDFVKMAKTVSCMEEFMTEMSSAGKKLMVVDFSATWCGPCKMIKPFYHSLVEKYPNVVFIEIDVDDAQDVAAHCDVKCMPTFQFYKNNEKVHEFSGANKEKLEETIKNLMEPEEEPNEKEEP